MVVEELLLLFLLLWVFASCRGGRGGAVSGSMAMSGLLTGFGVALVTMASIEGRVFGLGHNVSLCFISGVYRGEGGDICTYQASDKLPKLGTSSPAMICIAVQKSVVEVLSRDNRYAVRGGRVVLSINPTALCVESLIADIAFGFL
jgi:hypothetical protein